MIDLVVLVGVIAASIAISLRLWRIGARGTRLMRAAATGSYGMVLAIAMSAHIVDILSRWHLGQRHDGTPLVYGFHLYSLLLLGTVLTALGLWLLRAAVSLATGDARGRSHALGATLCALAIVVPLIPIQAFFAVPLSVLGGVVLLLLLVGR